MFATAVLTADWTRWRCRAAAEKLPVSATAISTRIWSSVMLSIERATGEFLDSEKSEVEVEDESIMERDRFYLYYVDFQDGCSGAELSCSSEFSCSKEGGAFMLKLRKSDERGHAKHGWLDSHHTFSFAGYYDPAHMGFRSLRVINEDRVAPGAGFGTHPHRDMEILSYVLSGALAHKDSMGHGSTIEAGDVQLMSAGTGVMHSEFNASNEKAAHFLQIWIEPSRTGLTPSYHQRHVTEADKRGKLRLVASKGGEGESLTLNADARVFAGRFFENDRAQYRFEPGRYGYLHAARGSVRVGGVVLHEGDGLAISHEREVSIEGVEQGEVLFFDLA